MLLGAKVEPGLIGEAEFDALAQPDVERPAVGLRDTAMLLYTSGTTAQPRGCRISHDAIVRVWAGVADAMDITAADAVWNPCPMFHIAAIGVSISCVVVGADQRHHALLQPRRERRAARGRAAQRLVSGL